MIKLQVEQTSLNNFNKQLNMKVTAIGYMTSPDFLHEVSKAVFFILGERFMLAVDRTAVSNPKKMHHVYEWNKVGYPAARLFVLNKINLLGGSFVTEATFLPSKVPVPIDPRMQANSLSGKNVTKKSIFVQKARVMEEGLPISYHAKNMLAFMGSDGNLKFLRPGTLVNIRNPGGKQVKHMFSAVMISWYNKNAQTVIDSSGLYEKIATEASLVLSRSNTGLPDVKKATMAIVDKIVAGRKIVR